MISNSKTNRDAPPLREVGRGLSPILGEAGNGLLFFHPLQTDLPKPAKFTYPFAYTPHPLCVIAAEELKRHILENGGLKANADKGKMFGVLVAETADGRLGFLAAYSGLLAGRNDHPFFVPPVVDIMRPDGYFKTHETQITALNKEIEALMNDDGLVTARTEADICREECMSEERLFRQKMRQAKAARDERRRLSPALSTEENEQLLNESRFLKAEAARMKKRHAALIKEKEAAVSRITSRIDSLKEQRKNMSDSLQQWLFGRYNMLNANGEARSLLSIFADTPGRVPPSGAGDCCAPKLLQHAYANGLKPVCMAEFWWGSSPKHEIRIHGQYYPACRGKCLPILTHMLQGLDVDPEPPERPVTQPLEIVYEDRFLAVVCKPAGMRSVPGLSDAPSVSSLMDRRMPAGRHALLAHRLDMDTSGLIIAAFTPETYKDLQQQFALRTVKKQYTAVLEGTPHAHESGTINLPLRPDPLDRPYQKVDYLNGKEAVTAYKIISSHGGRTRVSLSPLTGRTHQLRVHCAHADGLGTPIVGDRLYGHAGARLLLHAGKVTFKHPASGKIMTFERKPEF